MDILIYTIKSIAHTLTNIYSIVFLIVLAMFLYRQNKKTCVMQKVVMGGEINSPFELTISQVVMGIIGGILASIMMSYVGVVFYQGSAIYILFLISIALMVLNPKFICFSYSAAILGIISIISSYIANLYGLNEIEIFKVDITSLMTMVAILHFVEGILIMTDGSRGTIPIFAERNNKIIGGFILKRYWALPIALFIMLNNISITEVTNGTTMPNWWPIIHNSTLKNIVKDAIITLATFYGILGYNSVTFTKTKTGKAISSGIGMIVYSILLFGVAQLANINIYFKVLVIVFAPLAHEAILSLQRYWEIKGKPKYVSENDGIMVLDVTPDSPASHMGIESGDLLLGINDIDVLNEKDIKEIINKTIMGMGNITVKIKKYRGYIKQVSYDKFSKNSRLGVVFVPKYIPQERVIMKYQGTPFSEVLDRVKNNDKDE